MDHFQVSRGRLVYNGRKTRRICLVLDCLAPNDFTDKTNDLVRLPCMEGAEIDLFEDDQQLA